MNRLLAAGVIGFVLGILIQSLFDFSWVGAVYLGFVAMLTFLVFAWKHVSSAFFASVLLVGVVCGVVRTDLIPNTLPAEFLPLLDTSEITIEGVVVADPDIRETHQRLTIEVKRNDTTTKFLVVAPLYPSVRYGETVRAKRVLTKPEPFETDGGRTFRYDQFLAKDGVFAVMENAYIEVIAKREGIVNHIFGTLSDLKFSGIDALSIALPEPQAALASGLLLGGKQGLGTDLLDAFIRSGLVHIVVLSGYNVMLVAEFILRSFGFLSRRAAAVCAGLSIAAFVLIAGAGAASVRAGIMAGVALYARATGRTYEAFRALIVAGVLMLLINPYTLLYDPGFQLSFIATLGLIFGAPLVERRLPFITNVFLRDIVAATIAAQVAVLPLLLYQNGLFSLVALPANLLVLPVVPLTMLLSALALLAGIVFPIMAPLMGLPAYLLLSYIVSIVEIGARLPLAAFSLPAFPLAVTLAAYGVLILFVRNAYQGISAQRSAN